MAILNVIRCDLPQNDYLVWKWSPGDGTPTRANQVRWGSSLRVRTGETAAFFYSKGGGTPAIDLIDGPTDLILETKNIPVIANLLGLAYGGDSPFQAEVYFINKGQATQLRWGIPWFDAFDPRFPDFPVPVAINGAITFKIEDIHKFIEIQRLDSFDPKQLAVQIRPQLSSAIKANAVTLAVARGIPLVQLGGRTEDMTGLLQPTVAKVLEHFGLAVRNFSIEGIELNKESDGFKELMSVTRDLQKESLQKGQAMNLLNMEETLRIQRRAAELQTESQYIAAHQIDQQTSVGKIAAKSIGEIGNGGGGGGGGGGGLGAAAMMFGVGLPVGAAFGQQIASNIAQTPGTVRPPPPPPSLQLHVIQNGQQLGMLNVDDVNNRISSGGLRPTDLGWHPGLSGWQPLHSIQGVIVPTPPPPAVPPPPPPTPPPPPAAG